MGLLFTLGYPLKRNKVKLYLLNTVVPFLNVTKIFAIQTSKWIENNFKFMRNNQLSVVKDTNQTVLQLLHNNNQTVGRNKKRSSSNHFS